MPLQIRSKILLFLFFLCANITFSQSGKICYSIDDTGIIRDAYASFQNDLFNHYNFGNDSIKTYRTFLAEVASLSIDLKKLPSPESIKFAREFKGLAHDRNSLWVKLSDYENQEVSEKQISYSTQKNTDKEILIFNYRGGFIQCLKNTSDSSDFKEVINTLEEDGGVSPSVISQRIYYIGDKHFNTEQIKNFIAFDIYFSILMVVEKAFR